jgi:hypothetical protein
VTPKAQTRSENDRQEAVMGVFAGDWRMLLQFVVARF